MATDPIFVFNLITNIINLTVQVFVIILLFRLAVQRKIKIPFYLGMTGLLLFFSINLAFFAFTNGTLFLLELNISVILSVCFAIGSQLYLLRFMYVTFDFLQKRTLRISTFFFIGLIILLFSLEIINLVATNIQGVDYIALNSQLYTIFFVAGVIGIGSNFVSYIILQVLAYRLLHKFEKGTFGYKGIAFIFLYGFFASAAFLGISGAFLFQDIGILFGLTWLTIPASSLCAYFGFIYPRRLQKKETATNHTGKIE